jgi:hypothetical protein
MDHHDRDQPGVNSLLEILKPYSAQTKLIRRYQFKQSSRLHYSFSWNYKHQPTGEFDLALLARRHCQAPQR